MKWFHMYYFISVKSPTRHNYSHFTDEKLKYRLKEGGISDDSTSRKPGSNTGIDIQKGFGERRNRTSLF